MGKTTTTTTTNATAVPFVITAVDLSPTSEPTPPRPRKDVSLEARRQALSQQLYDLAPPMAAPDPLDLPCWLEETYDDYAIVCCGADYYKVAYTLADDGDADGADAVTLAPRDQWQGVEQAWVVKHLLQAGSPLRRLGETPTTVKLGGWLVVYGGKDLTGQYFTKNTDFYLQQLGPTKPVFYDHSLTKALDNTLIGTGVVEPREPGLWFRMELNRHHAYCDDILKLVDAGAVGLSSGTAEHLMRVVGDEITAWPLVEGSITPCPAEPRTLGLAHLRSLARHLDGLAALLPDDAPPPPTVVPTVHSTPPPEETSTMAVDTQVLDQLGAMAEQLKAFQTQMDPISAMLKRFDTEPDLKHAGYVSETGGTSDKNIKSFADWLMSVRRSDDVRLERHYKSTKAANSESGGETGGYLVPVEYAARIQAIAGEDAIVRPRAGMVYPMAHREVEIPMLDQFTAPSGEQSAFLGGVVAGWVEEAAALAETEPKFKLMRLIAHGLGGYTLASNDLRADSAEALDALLTTLFGRALGWHEDYAFLRGDGVGKPLGMLSWVGAQSVARHVASHFDLTDAGAMIAKLTATSMKRAVWVMSQTVIPELVSLQATSYNAWIQQTATTGLQGTLLGLPIIFSEKVPPLATAKDVSLIDWGAYVIGDREGIEIAFSEHYKFINRQGTWRFFCRRDGQPWLKDAITLQDGTTKVSPVVYLTDH